jgi:hypothetical protein
VACVLGPLELLNFFVTASAKMRAALRCRHD